MRSPSNIVRLIQEKDVDPVMNLAKRHLLEINVCLNESSLKHCLSLTLRSTDQDGVITGIIDGERGPCAYIVLEKQTISMTGREVFDVSLYVEPEYRVHPLKYAHALMAFAQSTSKLMSIPLHVSISTNRPRRDAYLRFLRRYLGDPIAITYAYDPSLFANT
jgi:hypothetical protein